MLDLPQIKTFVEYGLDNRHGRAPPRKYSFRDIPYTDPEVKICNILIVDLDYWLI